MKIHNVVNDFHRDIPFGRLIKKERALILARLRIELTLNDNPNQED